MGIYNLVYGNNSDLIKHASLLYFKDGMKIADVTYGKGVFWRKMDMTKYDFSPSDVLTCPDAPYDFLDLPYEDDTFDCIVFDPPYVHNPGDLFVNDNYLNKETTKGFYHSDIMNLYYGGIKEALRVTANGGMIWVKCKDEIESSIQRWSHIEIYLMAQSLGLYTKDMFVLVPSTRPTIQYKSQQHARKRQSYMWIFVKPKTKKDKRYLNVQIEDVTTKL